MKWLTFAVLATLVGCAAPPAQMTAAEGRALIGSYMPAGVPDKEGWAADIYTPMAVLQIAVTPDNICAIVSVTEQESGFRVDPAIPNLPTLAWGEIERVREKIGIPKLVLDVVARHRQCLARGAKRAGGSWMEWGA